MVVLISRVINSNKVFTEKVYNLILTEKFL